MSSILRHSYLPHFGKNYPSAFKACHSRLTAILGMSLLSLFLLGQSGADQQSLKNHLLPIKNFIFGDERPFPQCHASTLLRLPDGSFLMAWFGGTQEKDDETGIWTATGRPTPEGSG